MRVYLYIRLSYSKKAHRLIFSDGAFYLSDCDDAEGGKNLRNEDNNEKNRGYPLYHHAVQLLASKFGGKSDLVRDDLCADNMTDKNSGLESDDGHEHGVRDEIEEIEHLHAENLEVCKRAVAEDGERTDGYHAYHNRDSRRDAVPVELVTNH